ncbi:MAG: vWA domain-containing protein [Anaerolineae bacterium]
MCLPAPKPADIVMLIDTSSSMTGDKIRQAQTAAKTFVDLLDLPRDHALVLAFDEQPRATTGLTGDRAILERAIDGLTIGVGTRIDRALAAADAALAPTRADPNRRAIVVLLTDGGQSGPLPPVFVAADALRANGTVVYAIALGPDADRGLLGQIAGPGRLFTAPTAADLAEIYAQVAAVTGCR